MSDAIKKYILQLMLGVDGLHAIVIADRDGVPIMKVNTDHAPDFALRPAFLATFSTAGDQGSKMGFGKNKTIISMYSNFQVIQINKWPLMITLIANSNANTGLITKLEQPLEAVLQDLNVIEI